MAEDFGIIPLAPVDLEFEHARDVIPARMAAAILNLLEEIGLYRAHRIAAHFPVVGVEQILLPHQELLHPLLRQAEQVEHDEDRIGFGELLDEIAVAAIPERVDQGGRAALEIALERGHLLRREAGVERLAVAGVDRRVGLGRDHQPVLADRLRPLAHAVLGEVVGVAQHRHDVVVAGQQPAGLVAGEDVGDVGDRPERAVHFGDQRFLRAALDHLAREQRQRDRLVGGHVRWKRCDGGGHGILS